MWLSVYIVFNCKDWTSVDKQKKKVEYEETKF